MAPVAAGPGVYDVALKRRQALMGASGPLALVKNLKVFLIAMFACIGGLLYGYNQGVFSGALAMPSFATCKSLPLLSFTEGEVLLLIFALRRYGRLR
jgi:hypothetical protein